MNHIQELKTLYVKYHFGSRNHLVMIKRFLDSAAGPILPDLAGFFNYHDGPALLSFLVAALPVILNRLPRVS